MAATKQDQAAVEAALSEILDVAHRYKPDDVMSALVGAIGYTIFVLSEKDRGRALEMVTVAAECIIKAIEVNLPEDRPN